MKGIAEFFKEVTNSEAIQRELYETKTLGDVSAIAKKHGYEVAAYEILKAQLGRVLSLPDNEKQVLCQAKKPEHGAQWGRGGKGYLDSPGFWFLYLEKKYGSRIETTDLVQGFIDVALEDSTLEKEVLATRSFNELSSVAKKHGHEIESVELLHFQAFRMMHLSEEELEKIAQCDQS